MRFRAGPESFALCTTASERTAAASAAGTPIDSVRAVPRGATAAITRRSPPQSACAARRARS